MTTTPYEQKWGPIEVLGGTDSSGNAVGASATGLTFWCPGGECVFRVGGTFGGATVALQTQLPDGSWVDCGTATTLTADGDGLVILDPCYVRAQVRSGSASGLFATLGRVPQI